MKGLVDFEGGRVEGESHRLARLSIVPRILEDAESAARRNQWRLFAVPVPLDLRLRLCRSLSNITQAPRQ